MVVKQRLEGTTAREREGGRSEIASEVFLFLGWAILSLTPKSAPTLKSALHQKT